MNIPTSFLPTWLLPANYLLAWFLLTYLIFAKEFCPLLLLWDIIVFSPLDFWYYTFFPFYVYPLFIIWIYPLLTRHLFLPIYTCPLDIFPWIWPIRFWWAKLVGKLLWVKLLRPYVSFWEMRRMVQWLFEKVLKRSKFNWEEINLVKIKCENLKKIGTDEFHCFFMDIQWIEKLFKSHYCSKNRKQTVKSWFSHLVVFFLQVLILRAIFLQHKLKGACSMETFVEWKALLPSPFIFTRFLLI